MRPFAQQRYKISHITKRHAGCFIFVIDNDIVVR